MRAAYVNGPDLLTPVGDWIAARLPHWVGPGNPWPWIEGNHRVFRLYGLRPHYRMAIFDYTRTQLHAGRPAVVRVRLFGYTVYERSEASTA